MDLKEYGKLSKDTGKTVIILVRNDLVAHVAVETKKIQEISTGAYLVQALDETIKIKEENLR